MRKQLLLYLIIIIAFLHCSTGAFPQQKEAISEVISSLKAKIDKDKDDVKSLKQVTELLINSGDYDRTIYYAHILDSVGRAAKDETAQMYASIYLGQALMMNGEDVESKYYMDKSLELATRLSNDFALASVYNGLGLYTSNIEMDYYRSINYFFEGIEAAKRSNNERLYSLLLCNISGIYYLKKDPEGLKYAQECYELGHKERDAFLIFCGSINSAHMFFLLKNYDEAVKYIKEAEFILEKNNFQDRATLYNLYGNILSNLNDDESAAEMFHKALASEDQSHISSIADSYLSLSRLYIKQNRHKEAIDLLQQGLDISQQNKNMVHIFALYEYMSKAYEMQGDYTRALQYYKTFHSLSDSVFNADKERRISELRIKYDTEKHENEVKQSKLTLLEKEKRLQMLYFILILAALILGGTYVSYYKKNKLYLQIVRRNQESIKRQANLERQIEELKENAEEEPLPKKYSVSSMTEEKETKLYDELTGLFRKEHIYRQNDLTKDKLATLLNTNRTYLSQVINKRTNLSFTHFINTFRIDEAVRILSDPDNDIPLKALSSDLGFNSITTFYTAFQTSVGMTPSLYREKVQLLKKQESKNDRKYIEP